MHRTGINISENIIYGIEEFADCIASAGFNSVFTTGNNKDFIDRVSKKCEKNGLFYESLHAPWTGINDMWSDAPVSDEMLNKLLTTVELASSYSVPIVVMHLSSGDNCPPVTDAGLKNFDKVINSAAKRNITLAFENQRKLGNLATIFELYGKDTNVAFCWDVGHEQCFAYGREYMPLFGDRCVFTHIHDNFCRHNEDSHLLPFDGAIDYTRTAEHIRNSGYKGTLMLEIDNPTSTVNKYPGLSLEQYVSKAISAANKINELCE